jgi:hypothetical protein
MYWRRSIASAAVSPQDVAAEDVQSPSAFVVRRR